MSPTQDETTPPHTEPCNVTATGVAGHERCVPGLLSVIVPVFNEAESIERLCLAVRGAPVEKEVIVVDDGSSDATELILRRLAPDVPLTLIRHVRNYGKGASIRSALTLAQGEYVLIQDGDLEYSPTDYSALLAPLREGCGSVVYGCRPARPERGALFHYGARLLTGLANVLFEAGISDEATCYKVFRTSLLRSLELECIGFEFCPEVTAKLCRRGERIIEVPISYSPRGRLGGKKIKLSDGVTAVWTLLRLRFLVLHNLFAPAATAISVEFVLQARRGVVVESRSGSELIQRIEAAGCRRSATAS
jgi:dolichol-phosphate mannosyltransferase